MHNNHTPTDTLSCKYILEIEMLWNEDIVKLILGPPQLITTTISSAGDIKEVLARGGICKYHFDLVYQREWDMGIILLGGPQSRQSCHVLTILSRTY